MSCLFHLCLVGSDDIVRLALNSLGKSELLGCFRTCWNFGMKLQSRQSLEQERRGQGDLEHGGDDMLVAHTEGAHNAAELVLFNLERGGTRERGGVHGQTREGEFGDNAVNETCSNQKSTLSSQRAPASILNWRYKRFQQVLALVRKRACIFW
jgi:hypothetical protein